jgi:hypothetical protein
MTPRLMYAGSVGARSTLPAATLSRCFVELEIMLHRPSECALSLRSLRSRNRARVQGAH